MKKILLMILAAALLLSMAACGLDQNVPAPSMPETTASTQPVQETVLNETVATMTDGVFTENSMICGIPVGGMEPAQALVALRQAAEAYELELSVNGEEVSLTGGDFGLKVDENQFECFCQAIASGTVFEGQLLEYSHDQLYLLLSGALETPVRDAAITYDENQNQFVAEPAQTGRVFAMSDLSDQVRRIVCSLTPEYGIRVPFSEMQPSLKESDAVFLSALEKANGYLDISLKYTFTPESGETQTEQLDRKTIAGFIAVSDELEVTVNEKQVKAYAASLAEKHNVVDYKGDFITHYGTALSYTVDYYGQQVDTEGLVQDLLLCLESQTSGTRTAPYLPKTGRESLPYGGNYVEISLSAQQIWVYRNGECVVSSSVVSGSPAFERSTPTGVYSIYDKDRNCYLVGEDYDVFVSYWMAFTGAVGLHDASWRSYFGGEIYVYDGSHGCVNLPADVAARTYENVEVGTKVIVYGGITEVDTLTQEIIGTQSYDVAEDAAPFKLDAHLLYDAGELTYTSSNPNVVAVSEDGTVTVKGIGSATITVKSEKYYYFTEASMTVSIHVHSTCDEGRHSYGEWKQTVAPSCCPGNEEQTCGKCGHVQTREIPAVAEHTPGEWSVTVEPGCESAGVMETTCTVCGSHMEQEIPATGHNFPEGSSHCGNGCGMPNPDYLPPETEDPLPEEPTEATEP